MNVVRYKNHPVYIKVYNHIKLCIGSTRGWSVDRLQVYNIIMCMRAYNMCTSQFYHYLLAFMYYVLYNVIFYYTIAVNAVISIDG